MSSDQESQIQYTDSDRVEKGNSYSSYRLFSVTSFCHRKMPWVPQGW